MELVYAYILNEILKIEINFIFNLPFDVLRKMWWIQFEAWSLPKFLCDVSGEYSDHSLCG